MRVVQECCPGMPWISLKRGWLPWIWIARALGIPVDENVRCMIADMILKFSL